MPPRRRLVAPLLLFSAVLAPSEASGQSGRDETTLPLVYVFSLDGLDGDRVDEGRAPF